MKILIDINDEIARKIMSATDSEYNFEELVNVILSDYVQDEIDPNSYNNEKVPRKIHDIVLTEYRTKMIKMRYELDGYKKENRFRMRSGFDFQRRFDNDPYKSLKIFVTEQEANELKNHPLGKSWQSESEDEKEQ